MQNDRSISPLSYLLSRCIQHIIYKNPVSSRRIIYVYVGHSANQLPVLYNRAAAHE